MKAIDKTKQKKKPALAPAEQPIILEKPAFWTQAFVWAIIGITVGAVTWASVAKIEESVLAVGKLEPEGSTKDIQAPTGGVIRSIEVEDGEFVEEGDLLMTLDPTFSEADRDALAQERAALLEENRYFRAQINGFQIDSSIDSDTAPEFSINQDQLLAASQEEFQSRVASAELDIRQLETQLEQTQKQLIRAQDVLLANIEMLEKSKDIRDTNFNILEDMRPVAESGALSKLQFRQQEQRYQSSESDVIDRQARISSSISEVERLEKEQERLAEAMFQAEQRLNNTVSQSAKEIFERIAANQKRISDIEAQLRKADLALSYQEIRAPIRGTIFNTQVGPGSVVSGNTAAQPLMSLVPDGKLKAEVFITNRDIGFVKEGSSVEIRVDSFPSLEFGTLDGTLVEVGSDALPPTQERQYYAFPATIELEQQSFPIGEREVPLQAGMSVSTSILVRQRTVMTIFLGRFTRKFESFKHVK
ncbi:secretion protein HlyD family protein [Thalassoporum mexicanum PCC 7367]|uniref:HlyD family type I secretion periplasmic adaptor subunit n=1 Tax=Thalassoporum mexicanum TaxID=3457544 RepID=UPI00029F9A38|nr:HlyD family type I secretion periplasmic adaptor subunit [Pseudanabaena sp. PCC 7367]AFY71556.1 secretion protein HlyD family protein [Pseudanabaena sp. PCC 7367]